MDSIRESEELEKFSPLSDRRPFEVILRGGKPWGFSLAGGEGEVSPLHVAKIEENSRAENSALLQGDIVLSVNGISCGDLRNASQLIDSAFRTLTLNVLRGGWDASRGVRAQSYLSHQRTYDSQQPPRRERSGSSSQWRQAAHAHDDSALYAQSKAIQKSAMKPSRPRRGDSFTVSKSNPGQSPSTSDPPWSRPSSGYDRPAPLAAPRSSYPDTQRPASKPSDRRYSDAPTRYQPRERDRARDRDRERDRNQDRHMVSAKSSPNLVKPEPSAGLPTEGVKPVKSSSDIPDDVGREKAGYRKRPSMYEQQMLHKPAPGHNYGSVRYSFDEELRSGADRRSEKAKRYSEDMYTSDMRTVSESQVLTSHSLQKYQPDYENVSMLGTAPLQSEKISEIDDIEDADCDAPIVPPRPACVTDSKNPYSPTPPQRDPSSLKYIKVNQNHEKYPSWPVTQPSVAGDPSQPINTRAQSWTDHTNTNKEFPSKQRLAYQPGLRPLLEKNSPTAERKGEDSSSKAPRNSSDPGFKSPEFGYDRYGKVIQKKKEDDMKGRFEDFYQNSKPGYLPPRFDSDGHSYGDKEYSAPSPPERDVAGVDHQVLSQKALGTEAGEPQLRQPSQHQRQVQQPQPQEPPKSSSHYTPPSMSSLRSGPPGGSVHTSVPASMAQSTKRPGYLPMSSPSQTGRDVRQTDMATSPMASPRDSLPSPRDLGGPPRSMPSPSHRDFVHRDSPGGRQSHKPFIVKQTPYYNTSTQTDVQSYAVKMSDPRTQQCNVEIQVGDVSSQTSPKVELQEKSIQARMSREFQPSELGPTSPKSASATDKRNFFRYQFDGMQSIQAKYATDEDSAVASQPPDVFTPYSTGDQASIMRKLSEEFYGGNKLGLMGDKRHSSASSQEHSPKPMDSSSLSVYSGGTMSQAESYSSVIIHASESAGPFGRDDFGSQSSIADSRHELSSIASSSRSSLRETAPRGRNSLEFLPRSAPRPLQESKKFNSLSAISHQRELSAPVLSRFSTQSQETLQPHTQEALSVDTRWRNSSGSQRDSSSASEASSPSQPKSSPDVRTSESTAAPVQSVPRAAFATSRHTRVESADSVFSEQSTSSQRDRSGPGKTGFDVAGGRGGGRSGGVEMVGRKPSMKKAYGIYEESEQRLLSPTKETKPSFSTGETRTRGSYSDAKQLDQIQEEGDSSGGNREQRQGELVRHPTQGNIADPRHRIDSWRSDLEKRTGRMQRTTSEQISSSRDRSMKNYENTSRPLRLFDGSIDSGVGSEISSRADGQMTPSEPSQSSISMDKASGAELKKFQQQAVLNFVQRKTGRLSYSSASVEHSPESSLYESIGTPRSPHSPTSESVSDLISKTNENLAKRADSIRRSGSTSSSRASSSDYVDMNRQDRSRKETEWSRLRSSGSFHVGSNRSSLCSENTYEDISVFATPTPRGSTQEIPKNAEEQNIDSMCLTDDEAEGGKMESGMMASPTYQNFPGASRRRPPPPPPRTPSPEPRTPPALPPRNYLQRDREEDGQGEEGQVEEAKIDFKSLFNQWESNSPREDAYAAQLRREAMKISQRGSTSSATVPTTMSLIHSRTQMGISTSYKRQPMVAQEATTPTSSASGSVSVTSSVSSVSSLGAGASAAHRNSGSDVSSAADSHGSMSPTSHTKEAQHAAAAYVDRDTKPMLVTITTPASNSRPPQLPERTDKRPPPRADNLPPRDRSGSEMQREGPRPYLAPPDVSRDRSSSDSRVLESSVTPPRDHSRSPAGSHRDLPLPSPPRPDNQEVMATDHGDLPPPPPELLNDSGGSYEKGEHPGDGGFADDSYGAFKNRGSRQVGTYKRSSSAALLRPDNNHLKATEASSVFSDRKLGNHNWNSDSQLQPHRAGEGQAGGSSNGIGGPPGRPPDRPSNVPSFKVDSSPVRGVVKVTGGPQPLTSPHSQGQSHASRGAGDKTFTARPYHVEPPRGALEEESRNGNSTSAQQQPRSVKERISNLERKASFSSSSSSSTATPTTSPMHTASPAPTTSTSQRWANAAPFEATHRAGGEPHKPQRGNNTSNNNNSRVPNSRPMVLTDSHPQTRERPPIASPASDPSTQNSVSSRPRAYSERSRQGELPPHPDSRPHQRYPEVAPVASDPRALPGHVRTSSQNSTDRPRSSSSPYNRRESAPAPQIPPDTAVLASPRRKSEGNFLSSNPDAEKDSSPPPGEITVSHGRQPSQEELECDQRAKELAREVADSEKKLSDVLSSDANKKRMKYMDGLFSGDVEVKTPASVRRHQSQGSGDLTAMMPHSHSPQPDGTASSSQQAEDMTSKRNSLPKEYFVSPPKAVLEMEWRKKEEVATDLTKNIHDNEALIRQKEELIEKLYKKLDLLKEERTGLQEEIQENDALGKRVCETVDSKCQSPSERDKFHTYIDDLEKIVRLLLNLSGQLARAENAVQSLADNADPKLKKMTVDKRERLQVKHAEAKQLKEDIDKRSENVSAFLRQSLSTEELNDYAYFVKMKSKLTIELQELEDKITLGQEQIQELKKSIPERTAPPPPPAESVSSASSSPRSSPVPSTS